MFKKAMPWLALKNKKHIDLYFEYLDEESKGKLYQDLKDGHSIKLPNFGGGIHNIAEEFSWDDLDSVEKEKIKNALKGKIKNPKLNYDADSHIYKNKNAALNVIKAYRVLEAQREFSCITAPLPWDAAAEIRKWGVGNILERDLVGDGFEEDIHTTVKYGIHSHDPFQIRPLVSGFGPIKIILGEISIFENEKEDVIKISVDSPDLVKLNKLISDKCEHTNTHPDYIPHVTIAYVKPGKGKEQVGRKDFAGHKIILTEVLFSGNDYRETMFSLV